MIIYYIEWTINKRSALNLKINVHINYPDNIEMLERIVADELASIFIEKLTRKEIDELVKALGEDSSIILW